MNNKRIFCLLRKCKTLSRQVSRSLSLSRSSSYSSLRSKSVRDDYYNNLQVSGSDPDGDEECETIFVGSSRRRYVVSSKHLSHPLLSALIRRSKREAGTGRDPDPAVVKCEVVLFDHLLWMLENVDPDMGSDCLDELAELYAY